MIKFFITEFLSCRNVLWIPTAKIYFLLWKTARIIICGTWIWFQWNSGAIQATYHQQQRLGRLQSPFQLHSSPPLSHPTSFLSDVRRRTPHRHVSHSMTNCSAWVYSCKMMMLILLAFWDLILTLKISSSSRIVWLLNISRTAYGLDGPGIESRWGEVFRTSLDRPWGPPSLLYNGYRVFPGGKVLPGRDADPSPPSSAEV